MMLSDLSFQKKEMFILQFAAIRKNTMNEGITGGQKNPLKWHSDVFFNSGTLNMKCIQGHINIWAATFFP